jgi:hypothetical protein
MELYGRNGRTKGKKTRSMPCRVEKCRVVVSYGGGELVM